MSEAECIMNLVFHVTVISPLADFIGSTGGGKVAKNIFRDDALHYLRGDYLSPLPAPEWIQEVFQKAHCWEIKRVMEGHNVNEAYQRLLELRATLVRRWAEKNAPKIPEKKVVLAPVKEKTPRGFWSKERIDALIGLTVRDVAERTGKTELSVRMMMFRNGLKTVGHSGVIARK